MYASINASLRYSTKGDWTTLKDLNKNKCLFLNDDEREVDRIHRTGKWLDHLFAVENFWKLSALGKNKRKLINIYRKICAIND